MKVHFIWFGYKPAWVDAHIAAWKNALPSDCEVMFWDDVSASRFLPDDPGKEKFKTIQGSKSHFLLETWQGNIARARILNEFGGLYLDCDSVPFVDQYPINFPSSDDVDLCGVEIGGLIDNCILWAKPGFLEKAPEIEENELQLAKQGVWMWEAHQQGKIKIERIPELMFWPTRAGRHVKEKWDSQASALHFRSGAMWMDGQELELLAEYASGAKSALEFGVGGTSHTLAEMAEQLTVVDSSIEWVDYCQKYVRPTNLFFRRFIVPSVREMIRESSPDFILCDSLGQSKCNVVERVLSHAESGTKIVVHDLKGDHFEGADRMMDLLFEKCANAILHDTRRGLFFGTVK